MWAVGIFQLFTTAKTFEIIIDVIIIVGIMAAGIFMAKIKPRGE